MRHSGFWMVQRNEKDFNRLEYLPIVNTVAFIDTAEKGGEGHYRGVWRDSKHAILAMTPDTYVSVKYALRAASVYFREASEERPVLPPARDEAGNLTHELTEPERAWAKEFLASYDCNIVTNMEAMSEEEDDTRTKTIYLIRTEHDPSVGINGLVIGPSFDSEDALLTFVLANEDYIRVQVESED